jgi:molecular chaperone GrpE (heat shock protein)
LVKDLENERYALKFLWDFLYRWFDNALSSKVGRVSEGAGSTTAGYFLVRRQLLDVLKERFAGADGSRKRIEYPSSDKDNGKFFVEEDIVECEFAKGYKIYEKLLRPALVSVLTPCRK